MTWVTGRRALSEDTREGAEFVSVLNAMAIHSVASPPFLLKTVLNKIKINTGNVRNRHGDTCDISMWFSFCLCAAWWSFLTDVAAVKNQGSKVPSLISVLFWLFEVHVIYTFLLKKLFSLLHTNPCSPSVSFSYPLPHTLLTPHPLLRVGKAFLG